MRQADSSYRERSKDAFATQISCTGRISCQFQQQRPPSETNSHSDRQEIPRLLWPSNAHCRVQKRNPLNSILCQTNAVHVLKHYLFKTNFNIIHPSKPRYSLAGLHTYMHTHTQESISKSFRTGRLGRELQMIQLSATRCSYIAIL
jgi:hypothetical protein